jgi:hypothetical protein
MTGYYHQYPRSEEALALLARCRAISEGKKND